MNRADIPFAVLKMIEDPAYDGNYMFTSMPFYRESVRTLN